MKRSFRYENDDENTKNDRSLIEIVLKKRSFSKTTIFKKLVVSLTSVNYDPSLTIVNDDTFLTIVNNDPSLTIVNKERRREETDLKGIGTYH